MVKKMVQARQPSMVRDLRNQARASFKTAIAAAEQRGYERGVKAALAITRGK